MAKITYIEHDGSSKTVDVEAGCSAMDAAVDNDVKGIIAACGGSMSCATCHCYVDPRWQEQTGPACEDEQDLLEEVEDRRPNSRLSCQIEITSALDGLVLHLPKSQY